MGSPHEDTMQPRGSHKLYSAVSPSILADMVRLKCLHLQGCLELGRAFLDYACLSRLSIDVLFGSFGDKYVSLRHLQCSTS